MPSLSVIIPTYNERENVRPLVERLAKVLRSVPADSEILVVDDDSPDGTARIAEEMAAEFPLRVLVRRGRRGLARSILEGFEAAEGDYLLVMDADLSHPPEQVPRMWEVMTSERCDLVVGSRFVPGGVVAGRTAFRRGLSLLSRLLVSPLTRVKDPLAGFFLVRREVVEGGRFNPIGFKLLLEILVRGGCERVREVPITFRDRDRGASKFSGTVMLEYAVQVVGLYGERIGSILKFRQETV